MNKTTDLLRNSSRGIGKTTHILRQIIQHCIEHDEENNIEFSIPEIRQAKYIHTPRLQRMCEEQGISFQAFASTTDIIINKTRIKFSSPKTAERLQGIPFSNFFWDI